MGRSWNPPLRGIPISDVGDISKWAKTARVENRLRVAASFLEMVERRLTLKNRPFAARGAAADGVLRNTSLLTSRRRYQFRPVYECGSGDFAVARHRLAREKKKRIAGSVGSAGRDVFDSRHGRRCALAAHLVRAFGGLPMVIRAATKT